MIALFCGWVIAVPVTIVAPIVQWNVLNQVSRGLSVWKAIVASVLLWATAAVTAGWYWVLVYAAIIQVVNE